MASRSATFDVSVSPPSPRGLEALRRLMYGSSLYRLTLKGRPPSDIHLRFPADRMENRPFVEAFLDGAFLLAGRRLPLGRIPWSVLPPGPVAAEQLHGFAWLLDLRAARSEEARARAQELVNSWIDLNQRWTTPAWRPDVLGRRLVSWLAASDFLLAGAGETFKRAFLDSAAVQARHLLSVSTHQSGHAGAMSAAVGRIAVALCLGIGGLGSAVRLLERELDCQILSDGGHAQRNPSLHLAVLTDLLDVDAALVAAEADVPPALSDAIEQMVPMLRAFRLGDGGLALFNGGKEEDSRVVDALLARSGVKGKARWDAPRSGFQRLNAGRTVIVADTGGPPPTHANSLAHAGPLAIEMSVGRDRLVVNCGSFIGDDAQWRAALKSTAAHSTVTIDNRSSIELRPDGRLARHAIQVTAVRRDADGAAWLEATHDGYRRRLGLVHRRRLYLDASGFDVRGEDALEGTGGHTFHVRFHLHPGVRASLVEDGTAVRLATPLGDSWRFLAVGGVLGLEESTFLGASDVPTPSEQIVVTGGLDGRGAQVKWRIHREEEEEESD